MCNHSRSLINETGYYVIKLIQFLWDIHTGGCFSLSNANTHMIFMGIILCINQIILKGN